MKKRPLHLILTDYLREHKKVHGGKMEKVAQSWGYEAETGKRRLREVCDPGHDNYNPKVKKMYIDGCVVYLWWSNTRKS